MLIVRGTKKLRDRVRGAPAADGEVSTTALGDWYATALFWRPQVALVVNARTLVPVLLPLAPAASLLDRIPEAIEQVLRAHGVDDAFVTAERAAMAQVRLAPTADRSVVGMMTEFGHLGAMFAASGEVDLLRLSLRLASTPVGPLRSSTGFPDLELADVVGSTTPAEVVPLPPEPGAATRGEAGRATGQVYQLKATLLDTKPPIWRRILVDGATTLDRLHEVIQAAFGWWNDHLHEFEIDGTDYGVTHLAWADWGRPVVDERTARLDALADVGSRMEYRYDFGDGWRHRIVVEKTLPADAVTTVPACVDGRRACPPEDCGGPWGYQQLLEILADPHHPEHAERRAWLGGPFDPEAFDPRDFTRHLEQLRLAAPDG